MPARRECGERGSPIPADWRRYAARHPNLSSADGNRLGGELYRVIQADMDRPGNLRAEKYRSPASSSARHKALQVAYRRRARTRDRAVAVLRRNAIRPAG